MLTENDHRRIYHRETDRPRLAHGRPPGRDQGRIYHHAAQAEDRRALVWESVYRAGGDELDLEFEWVVEYCAFFPALFSLLLTPLLPPTHPSSVAPWL